MPDSCTLSHPTPDDCPAKVEYSDSASIAIKSDVMGDTRANNTLPALPADEEILRLRELLFSREIALINSLAATLEDSNYTQRVSDVMAESILVRSKKDPGLSLALDPIVDAIVKSSLHKRRNDFVNALFPLIGPIIRKSITESFRSMLGSFSKSLEMAFSWKGLRWRIEAMRSGKTFSEIVMLNTLEYRVEQVFFIHSTTGLVLSHMANESVEVQDADMVSAMLTAIQDFVHDCFSRDKDDVLQSLQLGEFTIYIEKSSQAYLACVVRGTPPVDFQTQLRTLLELMLVEYAEALESFNGDTAPFTESIQYLETCLLSRYKDEDKPLPFWTKVVPVTILLLAIFGSGYWYYTKEQTLQEQLRIAEKHKEAVAYLRDEPGLILAHVDDNQQPPWNIFVLRDSLARSPEAVLQEKNIDPALFSVKSDRFISYSPSIVMRRVEESIQPPDTVKMTFEKGILTFAGTAPMSWIVSAREDARAVPGIEHVEMGDVRDPMIEQISTMIAEVENAVIEFPTGKDTPLAEHVPHLKKSIDTLVELEKITKRMGFSATLTIYGHADSIGNERRNYEISQARAQMIAAMLYARGSSMPVAIYGMGADYPRDGQKTTETQPSQTELQTNRRVELRVHFALSPSAKPEMFQR